MDRCAEELAEIERHKYFLSEKSGYDVGWEAATEDWDRNFADAWRQDRGRTGAAATACAKPEPCVAAERGGTAQHHVDRPQTTGAGPGWLRGLFRRWFQPSDAR